MKLCFVWEWTNSLDVIVRFDEGIGEVLRLFAKDGHEVTIVTWGEEAARGKDKGVNFILIPAGQRELWVQEVVALSPDVLLSWGSIDHKLAVRCKQALDVPWCMFLAGGGVDHPHRSIPNHFFVETQFHVDDLGGGATKALGVMTDVLYPMPKQPKLWDVFLPASFTDNKRYSLFADVVELGKLTGVAVGPRNDERCVIECENVYVPTFGYVSRGVLRDFYNASRVTVLPGGAWGGSQRTLLESLACGVPVVVCDDNFQLDWLLSMGAPVEAVPPQAEWMLEAVRRCLAAPPDPLTLRQFVLDSFTAQHYYAIVKAEVDQQLESWTAQRNGKTPSSSHS
jgi:hypothetical protein